MPKIPYSTKKKVTPQKRSAPSTFVATSAQIQALEKRVTKAEALRDHAVEALASVKQKAVPEGYEDLASILDGALNQAARGKGKERHANDLPFGKQKIQTISGLFHGPEGTLWQATKKLAEANDIRRKAIREGQDIDTANAFFEKEIMGAMVYAAAAIVYSRNPQVPGT